LDGLDERGNGGNYGHDGRPGQVGGSAPRSSVVCNKQAENFPEASIHAKKLAGKPIENNIYTVEVLKK
jgi:hypothetical protein